MLRRGPGVDYLRPTNIIEPSNYYQASELMRVIETYGYGLADVHYYIVAQGWSVRFIGDLSTDQITQVTEHFKERAGW